MRMWLGVKPKELCRAHLLGEHRELHAFTGILRKGHSVEGYRGLINPNMILARHEALVREMLARGYNHWSPLHSLPELLPDLGRVDPAKSRRELFQRCAQCRARQQFTR